MGGKSILAEKLKASTIDFIIKFLVFLVIFILMSPISYMLFILGMFEAAGNHPSSSVFTFMALIYIIIIIFIELIYNLLFLCGRNYTPGMSSSGTILYSTKGTKVSTAVFQKYLIKTAPLIILLLLVLRLPSFIFENGSIQMYLGIIFYWFFGSHIIDSIGYLFSSGRRSFVDKLVGISIKRRTEEINVEVVHVKVSKSSGLALKRIISKIFDLIFKSFFYVMFILGFSFMLAVIFISVLDNPLYTVSGEFILIALIGIDYLYESFLGTREKGTLGNRLSGVRLYVDSDSNHSLVKRLSLKYLITRIIPITLTYVTYMFYFKSHDLNFDPSETIQRLFLLYCSFCAIPNLILIFISNGEQSMIDKLIGVKYTTEKQYVSNNSQKIKEEVL